MGDGFPAAPYENIAAVIGLVAAPGWLLSRADRSALRRRGVPTDQRDVEDGPAAAEA